MDTSDRGLTREYLESILSYNPETGEWFWRWRLDMTDHWNWTWAGRKAGAVVSNGRNLKIQIEVRGKRYYAHRLAVFLLTGEWPSDQIDHKDGNGLHNWWTNLRDANNSQNQANTNKIKRGVYPSGRKYKALIRVNGDLKYLGVHETEELAQQAYNVAADFYFGEFARCNREAA